MNPAALLTRLIIEIQTKANEIAEASRSNLPEGGKSDPNLNLERLIQQAEADAEIAGYCTTEKSKQNRRDALVRSAASSLLALFVMDREKMEPRRFVDNSGHRFEETFMQGESSDIWLRRVGSESNGVPWSPGEMARVGMREIAGYDHLFVQDPGGGCVECGRARKDHNPEFGLDLR